MQDRPQPDALDEATDAAAEALRVDRRGEVTRRTRTRIGVPVGEVAETPPTLPLEIGG
jgi:hypothetical protein